MLDVGLFPGARETAVTQCCACLVGTRRDNEDISAGTSDCTEAGFTDAGATDANSACVCALPQSECEAQLLAGQRISVRGACTQADGVCAQDCENVLAYPD